MQVKLHIELHGNRNEHLACLTMASMRGGRSNKQYDYVTVLFPHKTPDPARVKADNRRVLQPHTERHRRLLAAGGEQREASFADGAYRVRKGSYGKPTAGRIPKNVITMGHSCPDHRQYRRDAAMLGLPSHGAPLPKAMYDFWIDFLTEPGDLCADIFGGRVTLGKSAEERGRRWIVTEWILEYVRAAAERFKASPGFWLNPAIASC